MRLISLALLVVFVLTGCWPLPQDSSNSEQPTPVAGTPAVIVGVGGGLPPTDGAVNIALAPDDPATLDPALATDPYSLSIIRQLFSGLLTFDANLKVVPDIAAAMPSVSADGKTYTFPLRRGVRFTNGQEVTSTDVKYSMERAADPRLAGPYPSSALPAAIYFDDIVGMKERLAGTAQAVAGIVAPDPYTLVITIVAPKASFLSKLATGPQFVVQRSNVESGEAWTEAPLGTGPFKLQKWERHRYITLARNTDYFGGVPEVPIVNILMGRDQLGDVEAYTKGGTLDVLTVPVESLEAVTDRNNPLVRELHATPDLQVTYLGFNTRQKPFDDPKIREAVARGIDRQKIARALFESRVQETSGLVLPGVNGYRPTEQAEAFNISRARQAIAESTYKEMKNLPGLSLFTSGENVGPIISQELSRTLGLDVAVHEVEMADYTNALARGEYQMFLTQAPAPYPDPDATLDTLFSISSPGNLTGYRNADVDTLLNTASTETDESKRLTTYTQVENQVLSEYVVVPLFRAVSHTLVKPDLRGVTLTPLGLLSLRNLTTVGR